MVKTRHSGDGQEEDIDHFLSLQSRRTRRSEDLDHQENGYESDESGVVESEMGRGRRKTRASNRIQSDTESDEESHQKSTRSRYRQRYDNTPGSSMQKAGRWDLYGDPVESSGRRSNRSRRIEEDDDDEVIFNGGYSAIRRSTRQRKLIYGTFNQSLIDKHLHLVTEPEKEDARHDEEKLPKKRRKIEVEAQDEEEDSLDMYTRVKRERPHVKRDMYGMPVTEEEKESGDSDSHSSDDTDSQHEDDNAEEEEEEGEDEEKKPARGYFLREHKPRTIHYEAPIEPKKQRSRSAFHENSPPRSRRSYDHSYRSPALKSPFKKREKVERKTTPKKVIPKTKAKREAPSRRRAAFHGSSSTSSSSGGESDDERRFERRKSKSMARSRNRCLPMNLSTDDVKSGVVRDRMKIGGSLADVDPMNIDKEVNFEKVGGLGKHVKALKEMVVFPLLYPEVFERFKIAPPRGVLFYGPPGTGKTLVARALANECSRGDRKVAFFMRKGADCLSKWVGESERQLRLLFDQAYQMRPSIIFFDEIDGLAPVRSSRQDQIHSSIVSTLLALMDGLDNRGEIVVIGATNRIDSIDPALRRPGRFDREFLFPLPSLEARKQILEIHTKEWNPKLLECFLLELGEKCVGYCGADLRALCTEAALHALRRRYPQIYATNDKLELDVSSIQVNAKDFHRAMQNIVPTAQRSMTSPARALGHVIRPILEGMLHKSLDILQRSFPAALAKISSVDSPATASASNLSETSGNDQIELYSDDEDDGPAIFEAVGKGGRGRRRTDEIPPGPFLDFSCYAYQRPLTHRPRLVLCGEPGQGQSTHLAPAVLHHMERLPVYVLDLPCLYAVSAKTPEESCAQIFREARRTSPSIIYLPHVGQWWEVLGDTLRATFLSLLQDLEPSSPLLLLATSEQPHSTLPPQVQWLFSKHSGEVISMQNPQEEERKKFFSDLLLNQTTKPPATRKKAAQNLLEELPKAKPPEPRQLTDTERRRLQQQEESTLRELRLFLRDVLNKLARDRKFAVFTKPVDVDEVPDYYEIITNPMDLSTMMSKIDLYKYNTVKEFLSDLDLICSNALEYNPDRDPSDRAIRHRACALRDTANAIVTAELDEDFEKTCEEIVESRMRRGDDGNDTIPDFYFTKPGHAKYGVGQLLPKDYPTRFSRRVRGMNTEENSPAPSADTPSNTTSQNSEGQQEAKPIFRKIVKFIRVKTAAERKKHLMKQSPWCRTRRKRFKKVVIYVDDQGRRVNPESGEPIESQSGSQEEHSESKDKNTSLLSKHSSKDDSGKEQDIEKTETKMSSPKSSPNQRTASLSPMGHGGTSPSCAGPSPSKAGQSPSHTSNSPRTKGESSSGKRQDSEMSGAGSTSLLETSDGHSRNESSKHHGDLSPRSPRPRQKTRSVADSESELMDVSSSSTIVFNISSSTKDVAIPSAKEHKTVMPETNTCLSIDVKRVEEQSEEEKETENSPVVRLTRFRLHSAAIQHANEELEASKPKLLVDEGRLQNLLEEATSRTRGFNIEQLERLYSRMSQCIYIHRNEFDKSQLVRDLEAILDSATRH